MKIKTITSILTIASICAANSATSGKVITLAIFGPIDVSKKNLAYVLDYLPDIKMRGFEIATDINFKKDPNSLKLIKKATLITNGKAYEATFDGKKIECPEPQEENQVITDSECIYMISYKVKEETTLKHSALVILNDVKIKNIQNYEGKPSKLNAKEWILKTAQKKKIDFGKTIDFVNLTSIEFKDVKENEIKSFVYATLPDGTQINKQNISFKPSECTATDYSPYKIIHCSLLHFFVKNDEMVMIQSNLEKEWIPEILTSFEIEGKKHFIITAKHDAGLLQYVMMEDGNRWVGSDFIKSMHEVTP